MVFIDCTLWLMGLAHCASIFIIHSRRTSPLQSRANNCTNAVLKAALTGFLLLRRKPSCSRPSLAQAKATTGKTSRSFWNESTGMWSQALPAGQGTSATTTNDKNWHWSYWYTYTGYTYIGYIHWYIYTGYIGIRVMVYS